MNLTTSEPAVISGEASSQEASAAGRSIGDVLADKMARHEFVSLILLLLLVVAGAIVYSRPKYLWYDELFSVIVAMQPDWHRFALAMPADGNPPLYPLLTRLCTHLFGFSDFVVRLPALAGFLAALTGVYVFVRRECGVVFGLLAIVLTVAEPGWNYSFEARPYTLMLAFMMLALVSWQSAVDAGDAPSPRPRRLALAGIVFGIVGSMLSHHMGIVTAGIPLLFGEGVRTWRNRRFDWPVLATALAALPTLAFTLPMAHRTNALLLHYSREFTQQLGLVARIKVAIANAKVSLPLIISRDELFVLLLVVFICWCPYIWRRQTTRGQLPMQPAAASRVPTHLLAATLGAVLLIPISWAIMTFSSGYYNCRYGIGSIAGISMLCCLLLVRPGRKQGNLLLILMLFFARPYLHGLVSGLSVQKTTGPRSYVDPMNLPVVVADPFTYISAWWYAPPSVRPRIVYMVDPGAAFRSGDPVPEVALLAERSVIPATIEDTSVFLAANDHFLLHLAGRPDLVLLDELKTAGYRITPIPGVIDSYFDVRKE